MEDEKIANFCSITDASSDVAEYYLNASGGDLEVGIGLYFEGKGVEVGEGRKEEEPIIIDDEKEVEEGKVFDLGESGRSFKLENESISRGSTSEFMVEDGNSSLDPFRVGIQLNSPTDKSQKLADLFRPPYDLIFAGSFEMARRHANSLNRWLLVTIHTPTEFACQAMNRDWWRNDILRAFVAENMIFWQVNSDSKDGERYLMLYPVNERERFQPHVAIIDPRTGERVAVWKVASIPVAGDDSFVVLGADELLGRLVEFVERNQLIRREPESKNEEPDQKEEKLDSDVGQLSSSVTDEPDINAPESTTIQFRMPDGSRFKRRFWLQDRVSGLFRVIEERMGHGKFGLQVHGENLGEKLDESLKDANLVNAMVTIVT